jgi:hypothetical protein
MHADTVRPIFFVSSPDVLDEAELFFGPDPISNSYSLASGRKGYVLVIPFH